MKKFALSIIFILLSLYLSNAQDNLYQVSRIKTSLKKGVDAVIRSEQMTLDIISMQKAVMHYKRVVTIFNEDADQYAMITVRYDKFSKITRLAGYGYSANGDREVSLKATNILDISAVDGNLLYSDDRMKIAAIPFYKYPYTIEFEYILEMDGRINYPEQVFGGFEKISVEHSGMQITTPLNTELRYVERNLKHPVEIIKNNKNIIYIWQEDFIPVFRQDPFTIPLVEKQPFVITAPDKFEIADYSGDMSSWKSTGEWINKLNAGRMDLPEDIVATVRSLIAIAKNDREKVEILYKYMQSTTRYVAVFLGIGGLQPEPASKVSSTGYGDCKALSNYMKALLKVAGIESHYTLVYGNESPPFFIPGFSSVSQFNHAILSVPMQTDTVWLECTDQKIPFGYLGAFTDDRYALQITDNGGQLVRTPVYSINDNIVLRNAKVDLNTTTDAVTEVNITAQGEKYENYAYTDELAETELQEWLNGLLSSPNFKLNSFTVNRLKQNIPEANVNIKLLLNRFASKSEKRMFITPYLFYPIPLLPNVAQWKTPIYIERSEQYLDSVTYFIPATYNIETLPVETNLQTKFGDYYSAIRQENGKLIYIRKFSLNKGTYPETDHVELREFLKKATKADKQKVVFIQG